MQLRRLASTAPLYQAGFLRTLPHRRFLCLLLLQQLSLQTRATARVKPLRALKTQAAHHSATKHATAACRRQRRATWRQHPTADRCLRQRTRVESPLLLRQQRLARCAPCRRHLCGHLVLAVACASDWQQHRQQHVERRQQQLLRWACRHCSAPVLGGSRTRSNHPHPGRHTRRCTGSLPTALGACSLPRVQCCSSSKIHPAVSIMPHRVLFVAEINSDLAWPAIAAIFFLFAR